MTPGGLPVFFDGILVTSATIPLEKKGRRDVVHGCVDFADGEG